MLKWLHTVQEENIDGLALVVLIVTAVATSFLAFEDVHINVVVNVYQYESCTVWLLVDAYQYYRNRQHHVQHNVLTELYLDSVPEVFVSCTPM